VMWKIEHLLIAYFLGNTSAKYYENSTMCSRVTAKNIRVFLRHHVVILLIPNIHFLPLSRAPCDNAIVTKRH